MALAGFLAIVVVVVLVVILLVLLLALADKLGQQLVVALKGALFGALVLVVVLVAPGLVAGAPLQLAGGLQVLAEALNIELAEAKDLVLAGIRRLEL